MKTSSEFLETVKLRNSSRGKDNVRAYVLHLFSQLLSDTKTINFRITDYRLNK